MELDFLHTAPRSLSASYGLKKQANKKPNKNYKDYPVILYSDIFTRQLLWNNKFHVAQMPVQTVQMPQQRVKKRQRKERGLCVCVPSATVDLN